MSDKFHDKAKDAGNKLKAYILSISTGATGVFFFTLTGSDLTELDNIQRTLLLWATLAFSATVLLSLIELHIDSRRFFNIASQLEKPESEQDWTLNERLKRVRLIIIYITYVTLAAGFVITLIYMARKIA